MVEVPLCVAAILFLSLFMPCTGETVYLHVAVGLFVFEISTESEISTASEEKETGDVDIYSL